MSVARSDEGSGNLTRRRTVRKSTDTPVPAPQPSHPTSSAPTRVSALLRLDDLYRLPMPKLFALAEREGIAEHTGMNRGQLIVAVVRRQVERGEIVRGSGTLEVLPDGYGFLRSAAHNYLASPEDIYVSPSQIRRLGLRTGLVVEGPIRLPIEGQENFALMQVEAVNGACHAVAATGWIGAGTSAATAPAGCAPEGAEARPPAQPLHRTTATPTTTQTRSSIERRIRARATPRRDWSNLEAAGGASRAGQVGVNTRGLTLFTR